MEELQAIWSSGSEDDLVRELLDDESPLFVLPQPTVQSNLSPSSEDTAMNRLITAIYSGPTIEDIENALSVKHRRDQSEDLSQPRFLFSLLLQIFMILV